jgi:hypothetical protein
VSEREQVLAQAIRERRISASQADEYRRIYDAQPLVMKHLLTASHAEGGLMPGLVAYEDHYDAGSDYDESWLTPQERTAVASRRTVAPRGFVPAAPVTQPAAPAAPAPAVAAAGEGEDYNEGWLSAKERNRIEAAKSGTLDPGPIQFEDESARAAAAGAGTAR